MTVLLGKGLVTLDGEVILDQKSEPATVRGVAIEALFATFKDEENLSGEEKLKRWELASKIKASSDPVELAVEEVALLKKLIGKAYGALIVGQAWKVLEGE
ncbi:MAG: hypothetical protein WCY09_08530 [Candidatus Omnitrophota bacterium]|jgi:hypothetical protein